MNILILEDEHYAAKRLRNLIEKCLPNCIFLGVLDSVEDAIDWFRNKTLPDLIFMDIQLADGISFSIFKEVEVMAPIIFTTAFDQYSIKAFKVNSVDYLLKPIDEIELKNAILKFQKIQPNVDQSVIHSLNSLLQRLQLEKSYKERFLVKNKDSYRFILAEEIAYFFSEDSVTFVFTKNGKSHIFDQALNKLENELNPRDFFRINRSHIVNINSIQSIQNYFNNRVKLTITPSPKEEVIVSRDKVKAFKIWLGA